jgi:hypothetical protein
VDAGAREPGLAGGVKRTALFRVLPGVPDEARERFERDTLEMAAQIPAIVNWRLSRAVPLDWDAPEGAPWSYVWEQELESGSQVIDAALCHAFTSLDNSLIVR